MQLLRAGSKNKARAGTNSTYTGTTPRIKSYKIKEIQKTHNLQNFQKMVVPRTKFTSTVPGRLYTQLIKSNENKHFQQWCFIRYLTMATYNITYE